MLVIENQKGLVSLDCLHTKNEEVMRAKRNGVHGWIKGLE